MNRLIRFLTISILLVAAPSGAQSAEIRMLASNAVKQAYLVLLPRFEKSSGHKVTVDWAGTADIAQRIGGGEPDDVVIAPASSIDNLIRQGRLAEGSHVDVAKSAIGVAIRPGAPRPDLASGETLKRSLLNAKAIVLSGGPSGIYLNQLFRKMGIADAIKGKTKQLAPGLNPGDLLAHGDGDIGFTQVSELLPVKGIEYLGPLPPDVQQLTVFSAGVLKTTHEPEAAHALVRFLTAPDAVPILKKTGLAPG
jgi:molybdate transport system substrate-binding protein